MNKLVKALAFDDTIRISCMDASDLVSQAQVKHDTWSSATAALGRTLIGAALMGSDIKDDSRLSIKIHGDGPAGRIIAAADGTGHVKGYIDTPHLSLPANADDKIDVAKTVGTNGQVTVSKDLGLKEPFVGQSPIISGEIAEDLTYYLTVSEQTPSAIGLGVLVGPDEKVINAGGWMIQVMPGASEETIKQVEAGVSAVAPVTELLDQGKSPEDIIALLLATDDIKYLAEKQVSFQCDCSKERFAKGLASLGKEEIANIIQEDGQAETVCHFCNSKYHFDKEDLENIYQKAK